jgi:hypothetical protein
MTRGSNVIPIGYVPSTLRSTMLSTDSRFTHDSQTSFPSHPPTQFFSADDILRNSVATTRRETHYSDRDTVYTTRDSVRDSVATTYTRASNAYQSTAIIAPAPVPVAVRGLQPKIVTFGRRTSSQPSPIPDVPTLTAEKVEAAERHLAASRTGQVTDSRILSTQGLGLDIPIAIHLASPRESTATSIMPVTTTGTSQLALSPEVTSPFDDEVLESPILGDAEAESFPNTPTVPVPDIRVTLTPSSPSSSIFGDSKEINEELHSRQHSGR